jgi:hypothetical protein
MTPLVEVHDAADLAKARAVRPLLTGINSRDLTTFEVDTTVPARLRPAVDWPTTLLFESGIHRAEDAAFARAAGFDGVLVGEAVVRRPQLVAELRQVLSAPAPAGGRRPFWERVFAARQARGAGRRPLVVSTVPRMPPLPARRGLTACWSGKPWCAARSWWRSCVRY